MIRRPPRSTLSSSSAASDVYKRQNDDESHDADDGNDDIVYKDTSQGLRAIARPSHKPCPPHPCPHLSYTLLKYTSFIYSPPSSFSPLPYSRPGRMHGAIDMMELMINEDDIFHGREGNTAIAPRHRKPYENGRPHVPKTPQQLEYILYPQQRITESLVPATTGANPARDSGAPIT